MSKARELAQQAKSNITELTELLEGAHLGGGKKLKAQSVASAKWQEKVGIKSKSYKIIADIADEFAEVCKANGKTQSEILMILMSSYIALTKPHLQEAAVKQKVEIDIPEGESYLERGAAAKFEVSKDDDYSEDDDIAGS